MILAEKQGLSEKVYNVTDPALQRRSNRRQYLKPCLTIVGIFLCLVVANLWVQIAVDKQSNEIKNYQEAIRLLERESIQVRIDMANLESFDRIQTLAEKELNMRIAGPEDYRCIAAAPAIHQNEPRPYNYVTKSVAQNTNLWSKVASWVEGFKTAMAQTP